MYAHKIKKLKTLFSSLIPLSKKEKKGRTLTASSAASILRPVVLIPLLRRTGDAIVHPPDRPWPRAARAVAEGDTPTAAVIDVVARQITEALAADSCHFVEGPVREARIAMLDHDGVLTRDDHPVDVERVGLP